MKKSVFLAIALSALLLAGCAKTPDTSAPEAPAGEETSVTETTTIAPTEVTAAPTETTAATAVGFASFPSTGYATDSVNVRRDASVDYTAIGGLYQGEEVTVLEKSGDWYQIRFVWTDEDGKQQTTAYVNAQYVSALRPTTTTTKLTVPTTTATTVAAAETAQ